MKNYNIIYQGNSVISVETHPEYSYPVVIKKLSKPRSSLRSLPSWPKYSHRRQKSNDRYLLGDVM